MSKFDKLAVSIRSMPFRGPFSRRMSWSCKNWCYRNQKDNWLLITYNFENNQEIFDIELKAEKIQSSMRWSRKSSDNKKISDISWPWRIYLRKSWLFSENKTDFSVINVKFKWFLLYILLIFLVYFEYVLTFFVRSCGIKILMFAWPHLSWKN